MELLIHSESVDAAVQAHGAELDQDDWTSVRSTLAVCCCWRRGGGGRQFVLLQFFLDSSSQRVKNAS